LQLDLVLVGFGNVARRFVSLLSERRATLRRDYDVTARIVGIATRNHGCVFDPHGLRAARLLRLRSPGSHASEGGTLSFIRDATRRCAAAAREGRLVVIETTTLNIESGQPAIDHVRTALEGRAHVVTANKGPAAFAHDDLAAAAARAERRFLFEGAVMDGIPIFNLVRETLPSVTITGFRGVVNSTTNFMLTAMEEGQSFDAALAEMQARGIAEADPSLDVDGWDAAAKTAALANVLLGAGITPHDVAREGITAECASRALAARRASRRLKLVAYAECAVNSRQSTVHSRQSTVDRKVAAGVRLEELPADDLLGRLDGQQNAIVFTTDLLDDVAVVQLGGGLTQTAYALLSDLITIARAGPAARATRRRARPARPDRTPSRSSRRRR
jgi:homoserine dehydrogenase